MDSSLIVILWKLVWMYFRWLNSPLFWPGSCRWAPYKDWMHPSCAGVWQGMFPDIFVNRESHRTAFQLNRLLCNSISSKEPHYQVRHRTACQPGQIPSLWSAHQIAPVLPICLVWTNLLWHSDLWHFPLPRGEVFAQHSNLLWATRVLGSPGAEWMSQGHSRLSKLLLPAWLLVSPNVLLLARGRSAPSARGNGAETGSLWCLWGSR